ncbi:MAG: hypothetical protein IT198_05060 [Acidimicrobiia bacterium]|nr:hypothetical protein [Acidimicrobiia bacterium]
MRRPVLATVSVFVLACVLLLAACSDPETIQGAATCEGAVARFLAFTARMQEELDPKEDPNPDLIHEMTDEAEALRDGASDVCGGDAAFMKEMARQRAEQEAPSSPTSDE